MSCAAGALRTTGYSSRYVALNGASLTSKHSSFSSRGQNIALGPFVRYDTKGNLVPIQWGKGKEEWAPVIWLYSNSIYVHVNPGPNKRENL